MPTALTPDRDTEAACRSSTRIVPRELRVALALAAALVVFRSGVFVWYPNHLDSDQAVFGLAAKHIAQGRAFPVFAYSEHYMLTIESWLAAPLFWLADGTSVPALKLPILGINIVAALLLIVCLVRDAGRRPAEALGLALFFVMPPPFTTRLITNAAGANIEPFLFVLLLWLLRDRPLGFGVAFAIGFLNREFVAYGLAAILLLDALDRSMFTRAYGRAKLQAAAAAALTWQLVTLAERFSSAYGPKTSIDVLPDPSGGSFLSRFCFAPETIPDSLVRLMSEMMGVLLGGTPMNVASLGVDGTGRQGLVWLWPIAGGFLVFGLLRVGWTLATSPARPWRGTLRFPTFLFLVGLQAALVYAVSRCGRLEFATVRYMLLAVIGATGLAACHATLERRVWLRRTALVAPLLLGSVNLWSHGRLAAEYLAGPPVSSRVILARDLEAHGVRFGTADYWTAYVVTFMTDERVMLSAVPERIREYDWLYAAAGPDAVSIEDSPCDDGRRVAESFYVCPARRR